MQTKLALNGKEINLTSDDINIKSSNFSVNREGTMSCEKAIIKDVKINNGYLHLNDDNNQGATHTIEVAKGNSFTSIGGEEIFLMPNGENLQAIYISTTNSNPRILVGQRNNSSAIYQNSMSSQAFNNASYYKTKKDIESLKDSALNEILNTNIYKFRYNEDDKETKQKIGVILGGGYKCSDLITNTGKEVNLYSMTSLSWKAIQEQQKEIESLKEEINKLKGEK